MLFRLPGESRSYLCAKSASISVADPTIEVGQPVRHSDNDGWGWVFRGAFFDRAWWKGEGMSQPGVDEVEMVEISPKSLSVGGAK